MVTAVWPSFRERRDLSLSRTWNRQWRDDRPHRSDHLRRSNPQQIVCERCCQIGREPQLTLRILAVPWALHRLLLRNSGLEPVGQDLQMVARQRQFTAEHGVNGPELGVGRVVTGCGVLVVADLNLVDDADDVLAGVSGGVAHDHEQGWLRTDEACFLLKLPHRGVNRVFTLVHKATGQRPRSLHRWVFSLDEQNGVTPSDGSVSGQCRVEPAVAFVAGRHVIHRTGDHVPGRSEWL